VVRDCQGRRGGGIRGASVVRGCTIDGNTATIEGGGLAGCGTVIGCTITNNSATAGEGGGLDRCETVINCTIQDNDALYGGGASNSGPGGESYFYSCLITGNSAGSWGGGLWLRGGLVRGCTIAGNTAVVKSGGVECDYSYTLNVNSCIVWGNYAPVGPQVGSDGTTNVSYSCVQDELARTWTRASEIPGIITWGQARLVSIRAIRQAVRCLKRPTSTRRLEYLTEESTWGLTRWRWWLGTSTAMGGSTWWMC
jgi:hypothetical protein